MYFEWRDHDETHVLEKVWFFFFFSFLLSNISGSPSKDRCIMLWRLVEIKVHTHFPSYKYVICTVHIVSLLLISQLFAHEMGEPVLKGELDEQGKSDLVNYF